MASNSQVHLRGTRPSAARAGRRCEYEQIRRRIQHADVVHIDETGIKRDGEQAWMWTFTTDEHTLYAVRESRGSDVPAEVLGEDFAGTVVCDGWTAYPAFTSNLQRCWAHILREAEDVADKYEDGEPIHRHLTQMYVGLQSWLETDPSLRERAQMHRSSQNGLKSLVRCSATDDPVATLLGKIKGGIDHWLTFIGEPAVSPNNAAAERMRFVSRLFSGKSSGRSATTAGCSFTRRCCPCWRHRASRDAIPTRSSSALSETTR